MKKIVFIITLCLGVFFLNSCVDDSHPSPDFEDLEPQSIYDYIKGKADSINQYTKFLQILQKGNLDKTLSAYNPNGNEYTLFLPTDQAIDDFIDSSPLFSSFDEMLSNTAYLASFARYHVVNKGIVTNDFPVGALDAENLTGQNLTVSFVIEKDTSYYKINNIAPVSIKDIDLRNGYIHVITQALTPVTFSSYEWIDKNPGYSIFKEAVDATGFKTVLDLKIDPEAEIAVSQITLFLEHDSIYNKRNITSFADLVQQVSPDDNDYTNPNNPLYNFVGYHILQGGYFLSDFEDKDATNYSTYGQTPLSVSGKGLSITINGGKENFDTIVSGADTTIINYIGIYYDASNILTKSGSIHMIDQMMTQKNATVSDQVYQFRNDPMIDKYYNEGVGEYAIEDLNTLTMLKVTGTEYAWYVRYNESSTNADYQDCFVVYGDFEISYTIPKLLPGEYTARLRANRLYSNNAIVEVFIDGVKIGGLLDLTYGGSASEPFYPWNGNELGNVNFTKYESHTITVKSLVPGYFFWDYIRFDKVKKN